MEKIKKIFCQIGKQITRFFCFMGWHYPINRHKSPKDPLRFLNFAECKWCGYKGQIDSQGNLF